MARMGAIQASLDAMLKSGDDGLAEEGGELISAIAAHAPDALVNSAGVIPSLIDGLKKGGNVRVMASILNTLDRVARTDRGEQEIRKHGGIAAILATMSKGRETTEDTLKPAFRVLERYARDPTAVKEMRNLGAVETLVGVLEQHSSNDAILRAGGRLLATLAVEDLEDTINKLNNANLSPETRQFMTALISNLALRPENVDKIVKNGGIKALTTGFTNFNPATQEAAARALGRLANSPENIEALFRDGAVEALTAGITNAGDNEALLSAATRALANMALTKENAKVLESKGAPMAVLKKLKEYPNMTEFADAALELFENMAKSGHDMTGLVTAGLIKAIIDAMKANPQSTSVQLRGFSTLEHIMRDPVHANSATGVKAAQELLGCGGVPVMGASMVAQARQPNVQEAALKTWLELFDKAPKDAGKATTAAESLNSIVQGVYPTLISSPPVRAVEELIKPVLSKVATAKDGESIPVAIKKNAAALCSTKSDDSSDKLELALMSVAVFSRSKVITEGMMKAATPVVLLGCFHDVIQVGSDIPRPNDTIDTFAQAVIALGKSDKKNLKALVDAHGIKVVQEPVKAFTTEQPLASAMKALKVFAQPAEYKHQVVSDGGIESCVAAMRVQGNSPLVHEASLEVLLNVAAVEDLAAAVSNKGGSKQIIKGLQDNVGNPAFEKSTELSLMVLEKVASCGAQHMTVQNLVKQGAVDAVIKAMEAFARNETIESVGARVLALLLDKEGVGAAIDKLLGVSSQFQNTKDESLLPDFSRNAATVGFLAVHPDNATVMREKKAGAAVINALKTLDQLPPGGDELARTQARKAGYRALGQMATANALDSSGGGGVVPFVLQALKNANVSPAEKTAILECIRNLASSKGAALEMIKGGAIDEILKLMRANPHDEAMITAALGALAALAEHEDGAKEITKNNGLMTVLKWFSDNKDTASPRAAEAAMNLLANLALVDQNVPIMMNEGVVDMVIASIDALCTDPNNPNPAVLHAAVNLLGRVAQDEKSVKELVHKGAVKRAIEIARSHPAYMGNADAMESLIFLLESCALVDSVRPELLRAGAMELITEAMNLNAACDDLVVTGAKALQTLMGSNGETVKVILKDIADLIAKLKKNPNDRETQEALDRALQNLANLAVMEGLVDSAGAADIAHAMADLLAALSGLSNDNPAKSRLIAKAAQALGRLPLIEGVTFDESEALKRLIEMMRGNPDDPAVMESVLLALSNLLTGPKALKTLVGLGGFDDILKVLATAMDDAKLREAAERALARAREIAENDPSQIDPQTLSALIKAQDGEVLRDFLRRMAQKGGVPMMFKALGLENPDGINGDLLRALREHHDGVELPYVDVSVLKALLEALRGPKKKDLTPMERAAAFEKQKEALKLVACLGKDDLLEFARIGGLEALLKMMMDNMHDPDTVLQCLDVLDKMCGFDPDLLAKLLAGLGGLDKLKQILAMHKDNPEIVKAVVNILKKLGKALEKMGLDEDLYRALMGLSDKIKAELDLDNLLKDIGGFLGLGGADMISASLDNAMLKMQEVDNIVEERDDDGKVYYRDKKTGDKSYQKPAAYAAVISAMEGLAKLTESHKEAIQAVNPKALTAAVGQLGSHNNEPGRLTALAKALATLASNQENRAAIAKAGGLQAILQALQGDTVDKDFVDAAVNLLLQFSKNDQFKDQVAKLNGIGALIKIMLRFIDSKSIVERCLSALANLAYNSDANVTEIVRCEGIGATVKVMGKWKDDTNVLQLALVLLNNCMYGSDPIKLRVGKEAANEIVNVCNRHFKDVKTFNAANRAQGNLSVMDANIRLLVDAHATKSIVQGMEFHPTNVEAQQVAIDVIGNFASLQEDALQAKIAKGEAQSVFDIIVLDGGAARILKTVKETTEVQILMSGMDALANLANDQKTTERLLKMGIVPVVINAMAQYDWDEDLMARTVRLVATLTFSKEGVKEIVAKDGIQVILSGCESHIEEPDYLKFAVVALKNIAAEADYRAEMEKLGGVDTILSAMEQNIEHKPFIMEVLLLFIRLTMNKTASEQIATRGMHLILKAIHGRANDAEFLTRCFILLGHLAFHDPNLKIIAQYGGVSLIIEMLCQHADSRELVLRAVQTLDNIAMASQEHAKIVTGEGGADAVKLVMQAYVDDPEVTQVCKSALITMTALETRAAKPRRNFLAGKEDEGYEGDPLAEHRNMLKSGTVMTEWSGGGPNSKHVHITQDFQNLAWRDPKKNVKQASTMPLRDIRIVRSGASDGHKKFNRKAKDNCAFSIVGRSITLDMETTSPDECKQWVAALNAVMHCVRRDQQWLR
jgi:hypothetical protein